MHNYETPEQKNDSQKINKYLLYRIFLGIGITIVALSSVIGIYQFSKFLILLTSSRDLLSWVNLDNPLSWFLSVIIVLILFGTLRYIATFFTNLIRFIFKIAQYDVVTIIIAVIVNLAFLILNVWITNNIIKYISSTEINSFFETGNYFSYIVVFCMLAGAFIWIPRTGVYGENTLGQFDNNLR